MYRFVRRRKEKKRKERKEKKKKIKAVDTSISLRLVKKYHCIFTRYDLPSQMYVLVTVQEFMRIVMFLLFILVVFIHFPYTALLLLLIVTLRLLLLLLLLLLIYITAYCFDFVLFRISRCL